MKKMMKMDYWSGKLQTRIFGGSKRAIKKELKKQLDIIKFDSKELNKMIEHLKNGCSVVATPGSLLGNDVVEILSNGGYHYKTIVCQDRSLTHNQALCYYM